MATNTNNTYGIKRLSVNYSDENATNKIGDYFSKLIKETKKSYSNISIVCIGTDRSTGDSFAPIVGLMLKDRVFNNIKVYGDIINPVHAKNLKNTMETIDIDNSLIIAIDASLCRDVDKIGNITVTEGCIIAGAGVGKDLGAVGDISITCNVNSTIEGVEYASLNSTRLGLVYQMADKTAKGVLKTLNCLGKLDTVGETEKYAEIKTLAI